VSRPHLPPGVRAILPIAVTVPLFAISFGVLARASGMGVAPPIVMSATTFGGSAQFAVASILDEGGSVVAAIIAALLLNARYAAIGISVAPLFRGSVFRRVAESQVVVDESWAVSARPDGTFDRRVLLGAGLTLYVLWVLGTAIGVIGGAALGDPERLGLDAAFPALFLALLARQLRTRQAVMAALAGGGIALVLLPFAPPGVPIVVAVLGCLVGLRR
jgi:4-azaleucine resistance transporter AzlC